MKKILSIIMMFAVSISMAQHRLKNEKIYFELDAKGKLISLKNLVDNREYAGGGGLWRIIYNEGDSLEEVVEAEDVPVEVKKVSDTKLQLSYGGKFPVKIECSIDGDNIIFVPEIKNNSKDSILREFQFPLIKDVQVTPDSNLVWTKGGGERHYDIKKWARGGFTAYVALDNEAIQRGVLYPGFAALNFYVIDEADKALYIANYDDTFSKTLHLFRLRDFVKDPKLDATIVKYPFLKVGASKKLSPYVVSPHHGDWHVSANKYRQWTNTWYRQVPTPKSIAETNGWHRIILKHQYGKIHYKYNQLDEIRKSGKEAGIDTLFMFGWWAEGMDAGNPMYSADESQGGDKVLRENVEKFQSDGGHVIVYYNGQLIDMNTDYYKTVGKKLSVKLINGTEHIERYQFGGAGTALREFGNKTFVTACPACPEWLEHLKTLVDRAISLGADGVFFDQLGYLSQTCWDKTHGHEVPCMDVMLYKRHMMKELSKYVKEKKPDMSFGIEWMCDPTSEYADFIHNCGFTTGIAGKDKYGKPYIPFVPVYRYMFPHLVISDREIRNDTDIERRVNLALVFGWISDVEIYRCRKTIDEAPNYKAYLTKANHLRDKYRSLILNGRFCHTDNVKTSDKQTDYSTFTTRDKLALVVTQSHLASHTAEFEVPGYEYVESGGLGNFKVSANGEKASIELKKDGLAVLIFKKKGWCELLEHDLSNVDSQDKSGWFFENGILKNTKRVDLWTYDEFENYELEYEYRIIGDGNSGIKFYWPIGSTLKDTARDSMEIQILSKNYLHRFFKDYKGWNDTRRNKGNASIYGFVAPTVEASNPDGEWNKVNLTCKGPNLKVVLNGKEVCTMNMSEWKDAKKSPTGVPLDEKFHGKARADLKTKGRIFIQGRHSDYEADATVDFKNIRIRSLE